MLIKTLEAKNVKGRCFTDQLKPISIFLGSNGAGKSSRMDSIRLALVGYVPELLARNDSIFKLSSGDLMEVDVAFDVGRIRMRWKRNGDTISKQRSVSDNFPALPEVLFDPKVYFALSPEKRIQFAFDAMKIDSGSFDTAKLMAKIKLIKCPGYESSYQIALDDAVLSLTNSLAIRATEKTPIQEWLTTQLAKIGEQMKLARAGVDRLAKTAAGMTELEAKSADVKLSMSKLDKEYDELTAQSAQALTQLTKANELALSNELNATRLTGLKTKLDQLGDLALRTTSLKQVIAELRIEIDAFKSTSSERAAKAVEARQHAGGKQSIAIECEKALNEANAALFTEEKNAVKRKECMEALEKTGDQGGMILALTSRIRKRSDEVNSYVTQTPILQDQHREMVNVGVLAKERLKNYQQKIDAWQAQIEGYEKMTACPVCKHEGDNWQLKASEAIQVLIDEERYNASALEQQIKDDAREAQARWDKVAESMKEDKRILDLNATIQPFRDELREAEHKQAMRKSEEGMLKLLGKPVDMQPAVDKAKAALDKAKAELLEANEVLRKATEEYETDLNRDSGHLERVNKLSSFTSQLASIQNDNLEVERLEAAIAATTKTDPKAIVHQINVAQERVDSIKALQEVNRTAAKQCAAQLQTAAIRDASMEERNMAEAETAVLKQVIQELQSFRSAMVDIAFGPLLQKANTIARCILPGELCYKDSDMGMYRGEHWVSHSVFSGTEQAITFASLAVALAVDSPFKLVLMDEMGRLDSVNKTKLMQNMVRLVEDKTIDQFIGIDVDPAPYESLEGNPNVGIFRL